MWIKILTVGGGNCGSRLFTAPPRLDWLSAPKCPNSGQNEKTLEIHFGRLKNLHDAAPPPDDISNRVTWELFRVHVHGTSSAGLCCPTEAFIFYILARGLGFGPSALIRSLDTDVMRCRGATGLQQLQRLARRYRDPAVRRSGRRSTQVEHQRAAHGREPSAN